MIKYWNKQNIDSLSGVGSKKQLDISRKAFLESHNIHYAQVVSLKDPYRSGNIGVRVAGIHEDSIVDHPQDVIWAPMAMPFGGGENYGFFAMPPVGSDVLVTFLDGDLKNPVVLGAWQSRKFIVKKIESQNELGSNLSGFSKTRAMADLIPNNFGSMPTTTPVNASTTSLTAQSKNLSLGKLTENARSLMNNFVKGGTYASAVQSVVPSISGLTPGVPAGIETAFGDIMSGKIGEIPGLSDAPEALNYNIDTQFGSSLTTITNDLATTASTPATSIYDKIAALEPQATTLQAKNTSQKNLITAVKANAMEHLSGAPGAIARGMDTLKNNLSSSGISPAITGTLDTLKTYNPQMSGLLDANLDKIIAVGTANPSLMEATNGTFDGVLKNVRLAAETMDGSLDSTKVINALKNGSVDYVMSTDSSEQLVFGPQCPLPYRNQLPARTLYELGENLTNDIITGKEELDSCYLSTDKKDDRNGQYLTPEPLNYTWKSPQGSCIEIDDTGFANETASEPKGIDNRGIRLTTKKGALLHLVDEKSYEGILVRDKNNNYIWIDSQTNTIHIYSQNGLIENVVADKSLNCVNKREAITGDHIAYIDKDKKTTIAGSTNFNCNQNLVENVGGTWSITVHGSVNIMAMQDANIVAKNKVIIGGATETIVNSAQITVKGGRIDLNSA